MGEGFVRFEIAASAAADYQLLTDGERGLFNEAVMVFNAAADRFVDTGDPTVWPTRLRVKSVMRAPGIFEMTWSFSGPDGRVTWEWVPGEDGNPMVRWRRIDGHAIFPNP